jgi:hypothetical protein
MGPIGAEEERLHDSPQEQDWANSIPSYYYYGLAKPVCPAISYPRVMLSNQSCPICLYSFLTIIVQ